MFPQQSEVQPFLWYFLGFIGFSWFLVSFYVQNCSFGAVFLISGFVSGFILPRGFLL